MNKRQRVQEPFIKRQNVKRPNVNQFYMNGIPLLVVFKYLGPVSIILFKRAINNEITDVDYHRFYTETNTSDNLSHTKIFDKDFVIPNMPKSLQTTSLLPSKTKEYDKFQKWFDKGKILITKLWLLNNNFNFDGFCRYCEKFGKDTENRKLPSIYHTKEGMDPNMCAKCCIDKNVLIPFPDYLKEWLPITIKYRVRTNVSSNPQKSDYKTFIVASKMPEAQEMFDELEDELEKNRSQELEYTRFFDKVVEENRNIREIYNQDWDWVWSIQCEWSMPTQRCKRSVKKVGMTRFKICQHHEDMIKRQYEKKKGKNK